MTQPLSPLPSRQARCNACPREPERAWTLYMEAIAAELRQRLKWTADYIEPNDDEVLEVVPVPLFTVTEERTETR